MYNIILSLEKFRNESKCYHSLFINEFFSCSYQCKLKCVNICVNIYSIQYQ